MYIKSCKYVHIKMTTLVLQIDGINGTMIANRNERVNTTTTLVRTVVTLDNGGEWNYLTAPQFDLSGNIVLCEPPSCSLHFQMASSEYARLGVYSQVSHNNIYSLAS